MNENVWKKNCPKCGGEQVYTRKSFLNRSIRLNKQCRKCMFDSQEYKNKHIVNSKVMWINKRVEITKKRNTLEAKKKWRKSAIPSFNSKEYKEKQSVLQKKLLELHPERVDENSKRISNIWNDKTSVYYTEEFREKLRIARIKQIENLGVVTSNYNPNACKFFDKLNKENGWNLQHALNGGEIKVSGYFLDAYDKERHIVVEYDEPHHYNFFGNLNKKDEVRQQRIINKLNPQKFLRYNEEKKNLYEIIVRKEG